MANTNPNLLAEFKPVPGPTWDGVEAIVWRGELLLVEEVLLELMAEIAKLKRSQSLWAKFRRRFSRKKIIRIGEK